MPIRDGGGDLEFGVKITADGSVFVDGVRAATEETKKLGQATKDAGAASEGAGKQQQSFYQAVLYGTATVEAGKRVLEELATQYENVKQHSLAAQEAQSRVEAVIRATQGTSGQTADTIGHLADEMSRLTKFDDTEIKNASATLLTFDKIAGDTFGRVIKLSADLAATGRGDLETWITILGKVGQEPVASLGALERVIGKLDPTMKVMIKNMADAGDKQGALNKILDELQGRVGGTAQETYKGLTKQIEGTKKAWDDLYRSMGEKIFDAQSKDVSTLEKTLRSLTEFVRSNNWLAQVFAAGTGGNPFAVGNPALQDQASLDRLYRLKQQGVQGTDPGDIDRQIAAIESRMRGRTQTQTQAQQDPWFSEPSYAPPQHKATANDLLDNQQKRALHDQDLQQQKAYLDKAYQVSIEDVQRSITLEGYKHDQLLESDSTYYAKIAALEQQKVVDEIAKTKSDIETTKAELKDAQATLADAVGSEDSSRVAAADARILQLRGELKQETLDLAAAEAKWDDAENKRATDQYKSDSAMLDRWVQISRQRDDYQRTLDRTVGDLQQEADLVGKTEEATRQANTLRSLALEFDQKRLDIQRQIADLEAKPGKDANDIQTITDLKATLDAMPEQFADAATKAKAAIAKIFDRKRSADLWGGLVQSLDDAFSAGFAQVGKSWSSAISAFKTTFEKDFVGWLYAQFAKPFVLNVVASLAGIMGLPGFAQAATTAAGGNTFGSAAGSFLGGVGNSALGAVGLQGGVSGFSAGFASGVGEGAAGFVGPSATLAEGTVGYGAAAGGAAEGAGLVTVEGALTATGWGVVIAAALVVVAAIFSRSGGGPKFGGSAGSSYGPTGNYLGDFTDPGTDNGRLFTPNQMDSQMKQVTDATAMAFYHTLAQFGGKTSGFNFEIGEDNDPNGTARSRVSGRVYNAAGKLVYNNVDQSMDDKEVPAAIALELEREVLAALQNSDLGDKTLEGIFKSVDPTTATKDQIDTVGKLASAYEGLKEALASLDMTPAEKLKQTIEDLNKGVTAADEQFTAALRTGDNAKILSSEQELFAAVMNRYNSELQMVAQLQDAIRAIEEQAYQFSISIAQKINSVGGNANVAGLALNRATTLQGSIMDPNASLGNRISDVNSYVGAIDTWYAARKAQIEKDAQAQANAANAVISAQRDNANALVANLQEQLNLATQWKDVLTQSKSMLDDLKLSSANPLGIVGRTNLAEGDVQDLYGKYQAASGQSRIDLANQLMAALKTYEGLGQQAFQRPSPEWQQVYNEIARDLSQIQNDAKDPAEQSVDLQTKLLAAQQQANMWASMTANASDAEQAGIDALNAEALGYYTWAQQQGQLLYTQQETAYKDQLNAITGGTDVNLFIAQVNKDMRDLLKSIDKRLMLQYGGGPGPDTGAGDTNPLGRNNVTIPGNLGAPGDGGGNGGGGGTKPEGGSKTLVFHVSPGENPVDTIIKNATVIKRAIQNA